MPTESKAKAELRELFDELETLLKNGDVTSELSSAGVNVSLAMVAVDGLRAYLAGNVKQAIDDFGTVAEEIAHRSKVPKNRPS